MKTTSSRSKLERQLDSLVSRIIRRREPFCVVCGSFYNQTAGHLFSRKNMGLRWDLRPEGNVHTQCWDCNRLHNDDPTRYNRWYIDNFGEEAFKALEEEADQVVMVKTFEMEELLKKLKEEYEC